MTRISLRSLRPGINPIIVKELRSRMRGVRAFATLTGVLLVMAVITYLLYQITLATTRYSSTPVSPMIGQSLFAGLALLELILVCGITPAVTAGAISGEHERQTYDMLLATPLRPASILWGKLISALSFVFLLIFAAIPLASLVFIFGGVSPRDMLKTLVVVFAIAVFMGVLGLFMSALFNRTGRATVLTYGVVLALIFGPLVVATAIGMARGTQPPRWILVPSPMTTLFSAVMPSANGVNGSSILYLLGGSFWNLSGAPVSMTSIPRPLYHYSLPLFGLLTLVLYMLTTRLVQPARRWRIRWKDALIAAGVILAFAGAVSLVFWRTSNRYERFSSLFANPTPVTGDEMTVAQMKGGVMVQQAIAVPAQPVPLDAPTYTPYPPPDGAAGAYPPPAATPTPIGLVDETPQALPVEQQAGIYAAVIRALYESLPTRYDALYVFTTTDDTAGHPQSIKTPGVEIGGEVRSAVSIALQGFPASVTWVGSIDAVPTDPQSGAVTGNGVVFTLGNIHPMGDGSVQVSAGLVASSGTTYTLLPKMGDWIVASEVGG